LKGLLRLDVEEAEGGKDSADEGCAYGEEDGDGKDGEINGDGLRAGESELSVAGESVNGEEGESDAENAAGDGEEQNFGESGLQDARGGGSEGRADGGFTVASDEAGELRVGEVDAGDEQDAEDGGHEEPEPGGSFADDDFFHRLDVGGEGSVGRAIKLTGRDLPGERVVECVEILLCLRDRDSGFETSEGDVVAVVAIEAEVVEVDGEWSKDFIVWELTGEWNGSEFVGFGEVEVFGQDAYDLIGCAGDLESFADHAGVTVEEALPKVVAEDSYVFAAFDRFFGEEVAAENWLDCEDVEKVGKSEDAADETRVIVG
jgi:hypothetical protein